MASSVRSNLEMGDLRSVQISKETDQLMGIAFRIENGCVVINRLTTNGLGEQSGLRKGDHLLSVNGEELNASSLDEAQMQLRQLSGDLEFRVRSAPEPTSNYDRDSAAAPQVLRALYDYNPTDDYIIPCKELGLAFKRNDFIQVLDKKDPDWWQGYNENGEFDRVGIFPSPALQQRAGVHSPQRRPYYERQGRLLPQPLRRRPLVLVGPPGVGRHELRVRLIESEPGRFAPAVAHTTRRPRPEEREGEDFCFVSGAEFQRMKAHGDFVETGQHEGDSYGTSFASVQRVVDSGLVCVLTLQPEGLRALRSHPARLMPYAVFVSQPSTDKLRALHQELAAALPSGPERQLQLPDISDHELDCTIKLGKSLEQSYGHLCDVFIELNDLENTRHWLVTMVNWLATETHWVPESWVARSGGGNSQVSDTEF